MLVATLWKMRTDITPEQQQQALPRRTQWKPRGRIVSEYWFVGAQRGEWAGITIADVSDPGELLADLAMWADLLEMRTHVAVTEDDGLRTVQQVAAAVAV